MRCKHKFTIAIVVLMFAVAFSLGTSCLHRRAAVTNEGQPMPDVEAAWTLYNEQGEVRSYWYQEYAIPPELRSNEEVVLFLLNRAAEQDPVASAAYYNLGMYYVDKDCDLSTSYFEKNLEVIPDQEDTLRVLAKIHECGCICAREEL